MKKKENTESPSFGEKESYSLYCTECGNEIHNKSFRIDELLKKYYYPGMEKSDLEKLLAFLGISVPFGENVLPMMPSLLEEKDGELVFCAEPMKGLKSQKSLNQTAYSENGPKESAFTSVFLTIESIVAMFVRMSGFTEIYELLRLYQTNEDRVRFNELAEKLGNLKKDKLGAMGNRDAAVAMVSDHMRFILDSAKAELNTSSLSFSLEGNISAVWLTRSCNGRSMPYALSFLADGVRTDCEDCLCEHCGNPMPWQFGAYRQKIIAVLGVQSGGKTSYMSALLDAIDRGETTTKVLDGTARKTPFAIEHSMVGDIQWKRFQKAPSDMDPNPGPLWLYQHGYEPLKTHFEKQAGDAYVASSPSVLVTAKEQEPVMYTLADVPGEAFDAFYNGAFTADAIKKNQQLLFHADSIFLILNVSQTMEESVKEKATVADSARNPQNVLASCQQFLPNREIPIAVIITAADKINGGNLRTPLNLAFDMRNVSPLILSPRQDNNLVYNTELMATLTSAANSFVDARFGGFFSTLRQSAAKRWNSTSAQVASFVSSSGTQKSRTFGNGRVEQEEEKKLYDSMRKARFGVTSPLLWLLAMDGFLPLGHPEHRFTKYSDKLWRELQQAISKLLVP